MDKCEIIYGKECIQVEYTFMDIVYYVYKKHKKWVIRKSRVDCFLFTNIISYKLDNGWIVNGDYLYKNKNDAIEFCLKQNEKETIKIYNEYGW